MNTTCIDRLLTTATESGAVTGIVAVATDSRDILYEGAFGKRDVSRHEPMTHDTVFMLASMTKALTSAAALQLVEQGCLGLNSPIGEIVPDLTNMTVLEGFDEWGKPLLRPAKRPLTLRHLLTHTSGFSHEAWSDHMARYQSATGTPPESSGTNAALKVPLLFDPGERWEYGISIDWVGKVVEAASGKTLSRYFKDHLTGPLGMLDTNFGVAPDQRPRLARVHRRSQDGSLRPIEMESRPNEYEAGGGGLYATARDYIRFLKMLLNRGEHAGLRILQPETVEAMLNNQIGNIPVTAMRTFDLEKSNDFELFPGMLKGWSFAGLVSSAAGPTGRSPGSMAWAGIANTYFWLDSPRGVAGVFMTQVMPFGDRQTLELFERFERELYEALA